VSLAFGKYCSERISIMLLLTLMVSYLLGIYFQFFIVKYGVLFGLFNFGLGLGLLNLNIIAMFGKRRLVRVDNPFHPFFLPN